MFRILEKIKTRNMKTLFLLILAATMFAACEKEESLSIEEPSERAAQIQSDSIDVEFIINRNMGIITNAYIAEAKEDYKQEFKVDFSIMFVGKTSGDASKAIRLKIGEEYRLYIYDNNNWRYYTQPFIANSNKVEITEMVRFK